MIRALAAKELKVLWASPLPYVLGAVFHATLGTLGWSQVASRGQAVFQPVVPIAGFLVVLIAPILAARSLAEETRTGTLELLLAARVPPARIVVGKYLALVGTLWALIAPAAVFAVVLAMWGDPDPGPIVTGLGGLALLAAALGAIGLLSSSLTTSQPVAAIGALFVVLLLWFAHVGSDALVTGPVLGALSISERLRAFAGGLVDLADVVYLLSVTAAAVGGAVAVTARRRWR